MRDVRVPRWPPLNVITPFHVDSLGIGLATSGVFISASVANSFGIANLVFYYPFKINETATAVRMSYIVGGVQSGNVDLGIYNALKGLIVNTGSTAQGAANTFQDIDITDTVLRPGQYFMAITWSTTSGGAFMVVGQDEVVFSVAPVYTETTGAFGLPATATFAKHTSTTPPYVSMGVHFNTLI